MHTRCAHSTERDNRPTNQGSGRREAFLSHLENMNAITFVNKCRSTLGAHRTALANTRVRSIVITYYN